MADKLNRLNSGEWIAISSATLLLVFTFFDWYGLSESAQAGPLYYSRPFGLKSGNAWQTLEVTPIVLALVFGFTVWAALLRLSAPGWELAVPSGAVVCVLGDLAALLILVRIVFPPDLGGDAGNVIFEPTLKVGIFLALGAACGIAIGGWRAMREEGASFAGIRARRPRGRGQLPSRS